MDSDNPVIAVNMLLILLTCTLSCLFVATDGQELEITIPQSGTIRGVEEILTTGEVVRKYLGIPYAQAERFEKPVNPEPWQGVKDCGSFGPLCYDYKEKPSEEDFDDFDEDCLNLNVYVRSGGTEALKPVMVWIHGGGYSSGSSREVDGSYLAGLGNVAVVSINYRLTVFGFIHDRENGFTGNYGLFDQLEALKWVNRNIELFGGDPNRVTIFGNSAGGMSVSLLSLSPLAEGLFKYAIMQSGSSLSQLALSSRHQDGLLERQMTRFDCTGHNSTKSCLKSIDAVNLTNFLLPIPFYPVVDGQIITDDPRKLLQSGNFTQESTLMGVALNDGSCITNAIPKLANGRIDIVNGNMTREFFRQSVDEMFEVFYRYAEQPRFKDFFGPAIFQEYMYTSKGNMTDEQRIRKNLLNALTDGMFAAPAIAEANYYAEKNEKIFFYQAEYGLNIPESFIRPPYLSNGYHETEKLMVFGFSLKEREQGLLTRDSRVSLKVITMWSNFAKTGNPNTPLPLDKVWPEYELDTQKYMSIKPHIKVKNKLRPRQMAFWNEYLDPSFDRIEDLIADMVRLGRLSCSIRFKDSQNTTMEDPDSIKESMFSRYQGLTEPVLD